MIFRTQSGSRYEIDYDNKKIRRLAGTSESTAHQGKDGEWKSFESVSDVTVGVGVSIIWGVSPFDPANVDSPLMRIKTTLTSDVTAIES